MRILLRDAPPAVIGPVASVPPVTVTLFGQPATPGGAFQIDATAYSMAMQFSCSRSGVVNAVWFYSAASATVLPGTIALWAVSGASLVRSDPASWSGAAGSGWVRAPFAVAPAITGGASYKAGFLKTGAGNFYTQTANYWSSGAGAGGISSPPLTAPNNAGADGGQDTFNVGAALTYPATSSSASNYWIDVEVTA